MEFQHAREFITFLTKTAWRFGKFRIFTSMTGGKVNIIEVIYDDTPGNKMKRITVSFE